ncbi:MAG: iron-sulfur cluster assembly accessory protein [Euryarchaeota archaeon]|nr:iron-sulfur cluster assembly accessory protein [Euryarchaeota archaeon]|tara:strand:- start:60 stop:446 length:387 start_codon:yes stop_codon:yes gene_type:complete
MGLLGGEGFSLPVVTESEVVNVELNFTDSAKQALVDSMNGDEGSHVLVISAQSGGCSGYLYEMKIIEDPQDEAFQRIDVSGIGVLVHNKDSELLSGINVDFKDTMMGGGFQISNPNADKSCGCGQSFG